MKLQHTDFMDLAIVEAKNAFDLGEVPVGCIIVKDKVPISSGYNTREKDKTALGHAEMTAIAAACKSLSSWRLNGCTLYVTLEPCPMCMGAIINARIDCVVFGATDYKAGCCGSVLNLDGKVFGKEIEIFAGIKELECQKLLEKFFKNLR